MIISKKRRKLFTLIIMFSALALLASSLLPLFFAYSVTKGLSQPCICENSAHYMASLSLDTPIATLPLIGPAYAKRLAKLGIQNVKHLLHHYPHRYDDFSRQSTISQIVPGTITSLKVSVVSAKNVYTKSGKIIQKAILADQTGQIEATWFNQPYVIDALRKADQIYIAGKAELFRHTLSLTSPEYELIKNGYAPVHTARLVPVYPETHGISSKWLRSRIFPLISRLPHIVSDPLTPELLKTHHLISFVKALQDIHFPETEAAAEIARRRLAFDELLLLQLSGALRKRRWQQKTLSHPLKIDSPKIAEFLGSLPFKLTTAQNQAVKEILKDLAANKPMNRLLQGDVGSGKTAVAAVAIEVCLQNNLKSVLLAPTTILARQHHQTLSELFDGRGISVELITSDTKTVAKNNLSQTTSSIIVGTHAILHTTLPKDIGLIIIDEQHRFGVKQRALLLDQPSTPHLLSMTATPIPRTIALTTFQDLDLSVIDEMPKFRLPVTTWVVPETKRASAYQWIAKEIDNRHIQAFFVCPLIDESASDKLSQVKAAQVEFTHLQTVFSEHRLDLLHGRQSAKDKQTVIDHFKKGLTDILVTTPVIEVGIDIPNANIIVIEAAERFGLAQLHQLRGRVGRGDQASYCLLFTSSDKAQDSTRLKAMETHHSGFTLAEIDLKLRGPGELYGLKQHGYTDLKIATFSDSKLIASSQQAANQLLTLSPDLAKFSTIQSQLYTQLSIAINPN